MSESLLVGILDSMVVSSLLRLPHHQRQLARKCSTVLDEYVQKRCLRIAMDPQGSLEAEWASCAGNEFVRALIVFWEGSDGIWIVRNLGTLRSGVSKRLRLMGLEQTIDRLLVKIALGVNEDKRIVSHDPDFWDPAANNPRRCVGNRNSCVARYLREQLGVEVRTLTQLLQEMPSFVRGMSSKSHS